VKPKGKGKEKDLIYKIPCECGAKYIGETGRPLDIRVSEHRRNWLKLDRKREKEGDEAATSSLLASYAVEHNHQINWEEVTILAKESNIRKKKIYEAAVMHVENNVISQPSIDLPPLWHSILRKEKREIIRERKPREEVITTSTNRTREERKRGREEECREESTKRPALTVSTAESSAEDRRHLYRLNLRRHTRRPARLIECN
jgi:hypothetical protein